MGHEQGHGSLQYGKEFLDRMIRDEKFFLGGLVVLSLELGLLGYLVALGWMTSVAIDMYT